MLLAIDIGNTSMHFGVFEGKKLLKVFRLETNRDTKKSDLVKGAGRYFKKISSVIVVSVVPKRLKKTKEQLENVFKVKVLVAGKGIDTGIKNLYRKPEQVGQDRLVNARAAYEKYKKDCVVVDFGTAITIDMVSKEKKYMGGVIVPGVEISLNALYDKAALLPKVELDKPGNILGRETKESMVSGAVYGFSSLCDGLVGKIKKKYSKKAIVVATGGMSQLIGRHCETVDKIEPLLTLRGLEILEREKNKNLCLSVY